MTSTPLPDAPSSAEATLDALRAGRLRGTRRLDLSAGLESLPPEVFDLADSLEVLNLSGNALRTLPDTLTRLHRLRVLFCSDNAFTELPAVLGRCTSLSQVGFKSNRIAHVPAESLGASLRWLTLTDNRIAELPASIGRCPQLQKLMLAGNALTALPETLAGHARLELLRVSANRFAELPGWLADLPRLSWLAIGGNPMTDPLEAAAREASPLPAIDWAALRLGPVLGEGASGVIHQASWQRAGFDAEPVAVKLFKGEVTSDGWPRSEVAACLAAQPHGRVIAVRGQVAGHPQGRAGLVMRLVDPAFRVLAGPPSLASCTRDVYDDTTRFTPDCARAIARAVASAAAHLNTCGLVHGDLYAHNVLWNGDREALLGDFGAASFVPAGWRDAMARVEARALGGLLEELQARTPGDAGLQPLVDACLRDEPAGRPSLDALAGALEAR